MDFPEESIILAKDIARKYKERRSDSYSIARMLYEDAFLEIKYGFDESLKSGKIAPYLHEVKNMCDCDSKAGIDYLVARELGLKPEIYSAYGMQQTNIGENPNKAAKGSHTFITVKIGKNKYILDSFYTTFGKIKFKENYMDIDNDGDKFEDKSRRTYTTLTKLSEQEYLERFEETRKNGGRGSLSVGRKVTSLKHKILLNFKEPDKLISFSTHALEKEIFEEPYNNYTITSLEASVEDNGKWNTDEGIISSFQSSNTVWDIDDLKDRHVRFDIPTKLVKEYVKYLEIIHNGKDKKHKLKDAKVKNYFEYFKKLGLKNNGLLTEKLDAKSLGINLDKYYETLGKIHEYIPKTEPEYILNDILTEASYYSSKEKNISKDNPFGFLYSKEQRDLLEKEFMEKVRTNLNHRSEMLMKRILAVAGITKNKQMYEDNMNIDLNRETEVTRYRDKLLTRDKDTEGYYKSLDYMLFKKDNPIITEVSSEDMKYYYSIKMQLFMFKASQLFEALELKGRRKGLEKLLRLK